MMNVRSILRRSIAQPCRLDGYAWQIDPYVGCGHLCAYCYALNEAETDWAREILTYQDVVLQLDRELDGLELQSIYMGWSTDPYQPVERAQRQTRRVLELLASRGHSVCILTKSDLVTRDIDLLALMPGSSVGISIAFHQERERRLFEMRTPSNQCRVVALETLRQAGIRTYVLVCPVIPFITDVKQLVEQVAHCADAIWVYALSMRTQHDRNWRNVQGILERHFPQMLEEHTQVALRADHPYWLDLRRELESLQAERGLDLRIRL
jgi:DNA repair photolyase